MPSMTKHRNSIGIGDEIKFSIQAYVEIHRMPKHRTLNVVLKEIRELSDGSFELVVERVKGVSGVIV